MESLKWAEIYAPKFLRKTPQNTPKKGLGLRGRGGSKFFFYKNTHSDGRKYRMKYGSDTESNFSVLDSTEVENLSIHSFIYLFIYLFSNFLSFYFYVLVNITKQSVLSVNSDLLLHFITKTILQLHKHISWDD